MNNFIRPGDSIPLTNATGATVLSGAGMLFGARVGIASTDVPNNAVGDFAVRGVFSHAKDTAGGSGGAVGANAYWITASKKFTAASAGNTLVGYFTKTCADADATCEVKLTG